VKFRVIEEADIVHPGEYLLHTPTQQIVMCGAFMRDLDKIKVLANGKLLEDSIESFQKINLTNREQKARHISRCKGCSQR